MNHEWTPIETKVKKEEATTDYTDVQRLRNLETTKPGKQMNYPVGQNGLVGSRLKTIRDIYPCYL
jgi:hypothetical protein